MSATLREALAALVNAADCAGSITVSRHAQPLLARARAALAVPDEGVGPCDDCGKPAGIRICTGCYLKAVHAPAPASPEPRPESVLHPGHNAGFRSMGSNIPTHGRCGIGRISGWPGPAPSPAPATCSGCGHVRDSGADGEEGLCSAEGCNHDCNDPRAPSPAPEADPELSLQSDPD